MVAHGDIDYTVCDESIAQASINDFPQLDIKTAIRLLTILFMGSKQTFSHLAGQSECMARHLYPNSRIQRTTKEIL